MLSDLISHGHGVRLPVLPRGLIGFHAMPTGAGFERRQNEVYSWEGMNRGGQFMIIQHTVSGRGELDYDGVRHALEPGSSMVLIAPHRHRYWLDRGQTWEYFWIGLNGGEALRIGRAILERHGPVVRPGPAAIDRMAAACREIMSAENLQVGAASSAAYAAVTGLYDGLGADGQPDGSDLPLPVSRARALIEADLSAPLGVERLARAAGLSRAHFVRLFTDATGEPPSKFVFRMRLERAARLLVATDASIEAVARQCGFASANYFAKAFHRAHQTTPSAYRLARGG